MRISLENNRGSVLVQGLLDSHWTPGVMLAVREEDILQYRNETVMAVVSGQDIRVDFLQVEAGRIRARDVTRPPNRL